MLTTPPFDALWRPLHPDEQNALWGHSDMSRQDFLNALSTIIQKGTEEEKKWLLI